MLWEPFADVPLGLCALCVTEATSSPWDLSMPEGAGRITLDQDGSWIRRRRPHERVCAAVMLVDGTGVCAEHAAEAVDDLRDPRVS